MVVLGGMGTTLGPVVGAVRAAGDSAGDHLPATAAGLVGPMQGIIFTVLVHAVSVRAPAARSGHGAKAGRTAAPRRRSCALTNLCKRFGGIVVADNINLTIGRARSWD